MAKTYHFKKFGSLWWSDGLPMFVCGREIAPNGIVWWFPWNLVLFVALLMVNASIFTYRIFRKI